MNSVTAWSPPPSAVPATEDGSAPVGTTISPACPSLVVLPLAFQPGQKNQAGLLTTGPISEQIMKNGD